MESLIYSFNLSHLTLPFTHPFWTELPSPPEVHLSPTEVVDNWSFLKPPYAHVSPGETRSNIF